MPLTDEQLDQNFVAAAHLYRERNSNTDAVFDVAKYAGQMPVFESWESASGLAQPTNDQLKEASMDEVQTYLRKKKDLNYIQKGIARGMQHTENWVWQGPWAENVTVQAAVVIGEAGVVSLITGPIAPPSTRSAVIESVTVLPVHLRPSQDLCFPVCLFGSPSIDIGYAKLEASTGKVYVYGDGLGAQFGQGQAKAGPTNLNLSWVV